MRKKYWKTGCVIATLLCLTACGKAQTGEITPLADNMIHLYLAEDNTVVRADADYQLKTPDAIASCVEDAMTALTAMETSKIEAYSYMRARITVCRWISHLWKAVTSRKIYC